MIRDGVRVLLGVSEDKDSLPLVPKLHLGTPSPKLCFPMLR